MKTSKSQAIDDRLKSRNLTKVYNESRFHKLGKYWQVSMSKHIMYKVR